MCLLIVCGIWSVPNVMAQDLASVTVRGGVHDRYNRIVLDWPSPVKYTMDQSNGIVTIQFNRPATLQMKAFRAAKTPLIQDLQAVNNADGVQLSFHIPAQSRVQAFWSGNNVAFDVLLMSADKPAFNPKDSVPKDGGPKKPADAVTEKPASVPDDNTTRGPQRPAALPNLPPEPAPDTSALSETPSQNNETAPATSAANTEQANASSSSAAQTIIHLKPLQKIGMAVFVRAGRLWLVLDQTPDGVTPQIEGALKAELKLYKRQVAGRFVTYMFDLPASVAPSNIAVKQDELNWDIYLQPAQKTPDMAPDGASNFELSVDGPNVLTLLTGQPAGVAAFTDDAVGDKIWVVPVRQPLLKIATAQHLAVVDLSPTIVGGVLVPKLDNLDIIAKDNQILVQTLDAALPLSNAQDRQMADDNKPQQNNLFTLKLPEFPAGLTGFEAQRQYVEAGMARQTDDTYKAIQVLDLARLYLQQGYGPEAEGALQLAQNYLSNLPETPSFAALQGMAYALAAKVKPALDKLSQANIQDNELDTLWQAYAYAQDKNWEKAFLGFRNEKAYITKYNTPLANRIALLAAESAVETQNDTDAQKFLNLLSNASPLNGTEQAARDYLQATVWLRGKDDTQQEKATTLLTKLSNGTDRYYRVKAALALTASQVADGSLPLKNATDTLEKLRFAWRGDRQEIMILQQLGQYYAADHNSLQAMSLWRQAISLAQNETDKTALQNLLQGEFNRLFVVGENKDMTPLQSLSLYQKFKDLQPNGEDGARSALHMADQLLQVDLVDEADALLQDQLAKQGAPDQNVTLGTKLATIRLIARNADGALKALDDSEPAADQMASDVATRRLLLRARALADLQKTDEALALLQHPTAPEGLALRADIFWRLNRWADAAHDLQDMADDVTPKNAQNATYTALIMRLAIVKALENDQAGLDQLNAQYSELMAKSAQAKAFNVMTASSDNTTGLSDLATIKSQVAGTELFEGFLKGF